MSLTPGRVHICVAPDDFWGCGYHRMMLPYSYLMQRGYDVSFVEFGGDKRIETADIFVAQRQILPESIEYLRGLQARGVKVIFEIDDHVHAMSPGNGASAVYGTGKPATKIIETHLREADLVVCATDDIAREYAKFNSNITVCQNAIPDAEFVKYAPSEVTGGQRVDGQIRIGWAGSDSHANDMRMMVPQLIKLMDEDKRIVFVIVGSNIKPMFPMHLRSRVEYLGPSVPTGTVGVTDYNSPQLPAVLYYKKIHDAKFDIAIAPLESTTFNRCKSFLKAMEYGIYGTPAVLSRVGPYVQYQNEAPEPIALFAHEVKDWRPQLKRLVADQGLRARLGRANLEYVRTKHLMSKRAEQWENAVKHVFDMRKKAA